MLQEKMEIKNEIIKQLVEIIDEPWGPSVLPNSPAIREPINGKKIKTKYIY